MCRNLADKGGIHTIIRERNRDIRFSSGIAHLEAVRLHEAKVPLRVQAHHNLTKSYCFHDFLLMYVNFQKMDRKTGDFVFEVDGGKLSVFVLCRAFVKRDAFFLQLVHRLRHVVHSDADVAVGSSAVFLYDLNHFVADKYG